MDINIAINENQTLPLVIEPRDRRMPPDLAQLWTAEKDLFIRSLRRFGAILFRGFDVSIEEFEGLASLFSGSELFNYAGGASPRTALGSGVYTSTEYPAHLTLALHNELSYSKRYPEYLYFYCVTAPEVGGETTLGDSRRIFDQIPGYITEQFVQKGILYVRNLKHAGDPGYTWREAFETDDREAVGRYCASIGAVHEWQDDGSLRLSQTGPAAINHPETGETVWFNQAHGFHQSELEPSVYNEIVSTGSNFRLESKFGDGFPIPVEVLNVIRDVLRKETIRLKWQRNDLLIVDNVLTAHGRAPVFGPRKIALAMA
jgi:alpha-ketoglutarate-dependent taurine dioxygenase